MLPRSPLGYVSGLQCIWVSVHFFLMHFFFQPEFVPTITNTPNHNTVKIHLPRKLCSIHCIASLLGSDSVISSQNTVPSTINFPHWKSSELFKGRALVLKKKKNRHCWKRHNMSWKYETTFFFFLVWEEKTRCWTSLFITINQRPGKEFFHHVNWKDCTWYAVPTEEIRILLLLS